MESTGGEFVANHGSQETSSARAGIFCMHGGVSEFNCFTCNALTGA
jgi:hypothetical protein